MAQKFYKDNPDLLNKIIIEGLENSKRSWTLSDFENYWFYNSSDDYFLPEELNPVSTFSMFLIFLKIFTVTNPVLTNENILFITKPIISELDFLLDTLISLDMTDYILNIIFFLPLMLAHDILLTDDILDPSKSLLFFSNSSNILFFMNFSIIDNRLLFLKSEKLFFSNFIYSYSFNFSFISASNKITLGSISIDILYMMRLITLSIFVLILTLFVNTKYIKQLNIYYLTFFKYFYSKSHQVGVDYRFMLLAFSLFFLYWSFIILTYDENSYSIIELMNAWLFYSFIFSIVYTLTKLSFYALPLLELTISSKSNFALFVIQFGKDAFAWYGLVLRIASLLIRLTLYDTLDDLIESYYVFFDDFIDDSGTTVFFISSYEENLNFSLDNKEQTLDTNEKFFYSFDLYLAYINILQGLFTFWFFLLEELFRLILGTFIMYIILIELYSGLLSYSETTLKKN